MSQSTDHVATEQRHVQLVADDTSRHGWFDRLRTAAVRGLSWRDKFTPRQGPRHLRCPQSPNDRERFIRKHARVEGMFAEQAIQSLIHGDALGFLVATPNGNTDWLYAVAENVQLLRSLGIYEEALVEAFSGTRTNHREWPVCTLERLFRWMHPSRLEAIRPIPSGDRFLIYRGVAGVEEARRIDGLSWTGDMECAAWFALRFNLQDPAIYVASVSAAEVWWHETERDEAEFVVRPLSSQRLSLSREELSGLVERYEARRVQMQKAATCGIEPATATAPVLTNT